MNQQQLQEQIDLWESPDGEVIRTIDINEGTVERIVKIATPNHGFGETYEYFLYRYFEMEVAGLTTVVCSVDLNGVDADRVIQELGERIG